MDYMNVNATPSYANNEYGKLSGYASNTGETGETGKTAETGDEAKKAGRKSSPQECQTCKNRKYQDGSDESNVSFKSAAHVSPEAAASAVRTHENMHVSNAYSKASKMKGEVVSASVTIKTSVCPECGRTYVSGGQTNTQIRYPNETNPYQKERKAEDAMNLAGSKISASV